MRRAYDLAICIIAGPVVAVLLVRETWGTVLTVGVVAAVFVADHVCCVGRWRRRVM